MALPSLATTDPLEGWLGVDVDADDAKALFALGVASTLVRAHTGLTFVDDDDDLIGDLPDAVWQVTVMAASRFLSNPEGVTQEVTGPFSVTRSSAGTGEAALYLTKSEKAMLDTSAVLSTGPRGRFTITTTRGDDLDGSGRYVSNWDAHYVLP